MIVLMWTAIFITQTENVSLSWPKFFGHKSEAMFDLWFFQHLVSGCVAGWIITTFIAGRGPLPPRNTLMFCLYVMVAACFWEAAELIMEFNYRNPAVFQWKNGPEHWTNRFIADPGAFFLGAFLARYKPRVFLPSLVFVIVWMVVQVNQPTCMTIQEKIMGATPRYFFLVLPSQEKTDEVQGCTTYSTKPFKHPVLFLNFWEIKQGD